MAILTPDKTSTLNGLKVNEFLLTKHNPNKIDMPWAAMPQKPLGVTVHNTDWISTASGTTPAEQYTRATYNGNMGDVRVHYYVDNKCAWQNLPLTLTGWHAADGDGDGNRKTISIECIMKSATDSTSIKSEDNCAKLVAYLLNKYGLNVEDNLFTHSHWLNYEDGARGSNDYLNTKKRNGKNCPVYILPHWDNFKKKVQKELDKMNGKQTSSTTSTSSTSTTQMYRVRKTWADEKSQIGAYSSLENAKKACKVGYTVFDNSGKAVYTNNKSTSTTTSTTQKIDVTYRVYTGGTWLPEVKNYNNSNDDGYAGIENKAIRGLAAKVSKGTLKYRVHVKNGGWLGWINTYNIKDWAKGCAGTRTKDIDGIQFDFEGVNGYEAKYRVSLTGTNKYLDWVTGYNNTSDGYAGIFGKTIDKVQVEIVKK